MDYPYIINSATSYKYSQCAKKKIIIPRPRLRLSDKNTLFIIVTILSLLYEMRIIRYNSSRSNVNDGAANATTNNTSHNNTTKTTQHTNKKKQEEEINQNTS